MPTTVRLTNGGTTTVRLSGAKGATGATGPTGAPGGSDAAFAGWINDTTPSATRAALSATVGLLPEPTGTNDTTAISDKLALGGQWRAAKGATYLIDPITVAANGVKLIGDGATFRSRAATTGSLLTVTGNDFSCEGATFDGNSLAYYGLTIGNGTGTTGLRATLDDITVTNTVHHGIDAQRAPDLTIENSLFKTCGTLAMVNGAGVYASSCENLTLRGNTFRDSYEHGCYVLAGTYLGTIVQGNRAIGNGIRKGSNGIGINVRASGAVVTGNFSTGNQAGSLTVSAPIQSPLTAGSLTVVSDNVAGWSAAGADREVHVDSMNHAKVTDNLVYSTLAAWGMRVGDATGSAGCLVADNQIVQEFATASGGLRIERENIKASGNKLRGLTSAAVAVSGSGIYVDADLDGITVTDNYVQGFATGITLPAGSGYADLLVFGNHALGYSGQALSNSATGSNVYVATPGGRHVFSTPTETSSANTQVTAKAAAGGWGGGFRIESTETGTNTVLAQAKITADGSDAWNSVASASSYLSFWTASAGTLTERLRVTAAGDVIVLTAGKGIQAKSPDGTLYKLAPPNGGGAATWVVA